MEITSFALDGLDNDSSNISIFLLSGSDQLSDIFKTGLVLLSIVFFVLLKRIFVAREIGNRPIKGGNIDLVNGL